MCSRLKGIFVITLLCVFLAGCRNNSPKGVEFSDMVGEDSTETGVVLPDEEGTQTHAWSADLPDEDSDEVSMEQSYKEIDLSLGIPTSMLYTYEFVEDMKSYTQIKPYKYLGMYEVLDKEGKLILLTAEFKESGFTELYPSIKHAGFYSAKEESGQMVLVTDTLQLVEFPEGDFEVLELFIYEGEVFFRVQTKGTGWIYPPSKYEGELQLGEYAVVLSDGTEVITFGTYDYIDQYVDGKLRVYSLEKECYYIIDPKGNVLKEFPVSGKVIPYRLYPDGYYYTRSDVDKHHQHAVVAWDGTEIIPYGSHVDDIAATYEGDGVFIAAVAPEVTDGKYTAMASVENNTPNYIVYVYGEIPYRKVDEIIIQKGNQPVVTASEVIATTEGKIVSSKITNGLVGPLAKKEYKVTDYEGSLLIAAGSYVFDEGWSDGYCVAASSTGKVLLDSDCNEVVLPEGVELVGRYAKDTALFIVHVTVDFKLWKYEGVPESYYSPVGVMDKELSWVIPPGELASFEGVPLVSWILPCRYVLDVKSSEDYMLRVVNK